MILIDSYWIKSMTTAAWTADCFSLIIEKHDVIVFKGWASILPRSYHVASIAKPMIHFITS